MRRRSLRLRNLSVAGAVALVASGLSARVTDYLIACDRSADEGHDLLLTHLGLKPLLDIGVTLGEGTAGTLGMALIEAAALCQREIATLSDANVSGPVE